LVSGYNEDTLVDKFIDEVLEIFGYGTQVQVALPDERGFVDELLFETPSVRREAAMTFLKTGATTELFKEGIGIVEAKQWDSAFDVRFSDQRPYRNASHQIKHYLENTPSDIQWGILTNGRKWRLYGTKDYETQTYYEVDLPELLDNGDLESFKYFYLFFRPAAFRGTRGTTFLDEVWSESETASQELGESLQDNIFTALRVLGRGFVETNDDLDIDPNDEEALDELKEQSLVFLYRLMFILYAEARGLIHPESQSAQDEYDQNFSFNELRLNIHGAIGEVDENFENKFSEYSTTMWSRLEDLFRLIDEGEKKLGIPAYNGGLFDQDEHEFLTEHEVSNQYLSEVIYRLSTTQNDEGKYVLADYADLDTRHLGSVYEGLLEHKFNIAPEPYSAVSEDGVQVWKPSCEVSVADAVEVVEEGELYVLNDKGERKSTGAYYTPDYVVTYIVEETVGPLVEEIRQDLIQQGLEPGTPEYIGPFFRRVTNLRILDPAMGSGHFLTKATGYLSEQVMSEVREAETEFGMAFDEQHIRRKIAKECIYGVDLNGMAVELAKLSMWLETLAADRPLAFLNHHFKQGNSLVGSNIEDIEELESDANSDNNQVSLAEFGATREGTIERLMEIYSEFLNIENESVENVREMKRKYTEIEQDELRQRLVDMANVYTAERLGLDIPGGAYERMAKVLEIEKKWSIIKDTNWFEAATKIAGEKNFLHWELEFPLAFYKADGGRRVDPGFDAVIGNPPWLGVRTGLINRDTVSYLKGRYRAAEGQFDLAAVFLERSVELLRDDKRVGFVVPKRIASNENYADLRELLAVDRCLTDAIDLGLAFEGVGSDAMILVSSGLERTNVLTLGRRKAGNVFELREVDARSVERLPYFIVPVNSQPTSLKLVNKINSRSDGEFGRYAEITRGAECGMNHDAISTDRNSGSLPAADPSEVGPYAVTGERYYIDPTKIDPKKLKDTSIYETAPKLLIRFLSEKIIVAIDDTGLASTNLVYHIQCDSIGYFCGLLSSKLLSFWYMTAFQTEEELYPHVQKSHLNALPIKTPPSEPCVDDGTLDRLRTGDDRASLFTEIPDERLKNCMPALVDMAKAAIEKREKISLSLLDYLGNYADGPLLPDVGEFRPSGSTILHSTAEDYDRLRVGTVQTERAGRSVIIMLTARYKPVEKEAFELDQWGYTETEPIEAFTLTNLTEMEALLVEAFLPAAVAKAGGFAGFRETATKRNSLVDRLKAITLPDPNDVADDLRRFADAKARAEDLDATLVESEGLLNQIVYHLYELTDDEIEVVESVAANN